jgi:hypothetical protein
MSCGHGAFQRLLAVRPHADNFRGLDVFKNLTNEAALNATAPGECSLRIATSCLDLLVADERIHAQ